MNHLRVDYTIESGTTFLDETGSFIYQGPPIELFVEEDVNAGIYLYTYRVEDDVSDGSVETAGNNVHTIVWRVLKEVKQAYGEYFLEVGTYG